MRLIDRVRPRVAPVEAGSYHAVCVYTIEIGTQLCKYKDRSDYSNQILIGFEIPGKTVQVNGMQEPCVIQRKLNLPNYYTSRNSGYRTFLKSWLGHDLTDEEFAGIDTSELLGKPALISVTVSADGQFSNIDSIMPPLNGTPVPAPRTAPYLFDMSPWNQAAFDALPDWAQGMIRRSTEYQRDHTPTDAVSIDGGQAVTQSAGDAGQKPAPEVPAVQAPAQVPAAVEQTAENTVDSSLLRNYFDRTKKVEVPF